VFRIPKREKSSQNLFQTFVQAFCNKDSKPSIKEGRRVKRGGGRGSSHSK